MEEDLRRLRCVVLGASGFIGTNLCRSLGPKVQAMRCFGRGTKLPATIPTGTWMPGDFSDPSTVTAAVEGMDVVFHLISTTTPGSSNTDKIGDVQSNLVSTLHLLEACKQQKVQRVVFVSSGGAIYGPSRKAPTPEDAPTDPLNSYGITKLAIEKYLSVYRHLYGLDYRILRVANPYGPYQTAWKKQGAVAAFMERALRGEPIDIWGDGSTTRDYLYISDVVNALEMVATHKGESRIFNIGSGKNHSLLQIAHLIEELVGRRQHVRFSEARKADVHDSLLSIHRAESELDWRPIVGIEQGLELTFKWMKRQEEEKSGHFQDVT